ncbi:MAG: host-nuclease inhibitor Gam family protein [Syntrophus sp. (in: bacteria)]|jgi:hypothetical protein|nr:host-nuclease inhibitor Gam family protein [Syntrophus sp. (in: bacteria)]
MGERTIGPLEKVAMAINAKHERARAGSADHQRSDAMLAEIAQVTRDLEGMKAEAEARLEKLRNECQERMAPIAARLDELDKNLKKFAKKRSKAIFGEREAGYIGSLRVDLPHGALIFSAEMRVKKARKVLDAMKELGIKDGIKVVETVDWDALEKWSDERLITVGTERKRKEEYVYEVKRQ